ncbi:MAG: DUF421 domain-containing protein [Sphaerobacter sp.]|nr:DUF421 domain-containing protein [Sphaerobacter sp.]
MPSDLLRLSIPAWDLALRSTLIYLALFIGLRLFGKREVGQFTLTDLVLILLVSNAVQPAMTGPDTSLGGGFLIIGVLLLVNWVVGRLLPRSAWFRRLLTPRPSVIAQDGHWILPALAHEGMDVDEGEMVVREHGLRDVGDVQLAVLEADGTISVVPRQSQVLRSRRPRLRSRERDTG